jgi:hypothetical protein
MIRGSSRDCHDGQSCWGSPSTQYRIWLAGVSERDYCKVAYQLSHELGHVMMDPSRDNGAIEMLPVAVSLEALS